MLGQKVGTKLGRPQVSLVRDPLALRILRRFRKTTEPGQLLSSHRSLTSYNLWLKKAAEAFGLERYDAVAGWRWAGGALVVLW